MKPYDVEWEMSGTYRVYAEDEDAALREFSMVSAYEAIEDGFGRPEAYWAFEVEEDND